MVNISGMKMFAKFLGTFILAASIEFMTLYDSGSQNSFLFCILAGFFTAITLTREISGGHINPGVTLTFYLAEQDPRAKDEKSNELWMYITSQMAGAILAGMFGAMIYNQNMFQLLPHRSSFASEAFICEILGSTVFFLVILVQGDSNSKLHSDKTLSTLCVTAGLACGIALAGNTSGAGLNPAIALDSTSENFYLLVKLKNVNFYGFIF